VNLVTTDSEIYGAVPRGTALDVAAVNVADATHSLFRIGADYIATAEGDRITVYH
jgi:hypothetical protein